MASGEKPWFKLWPKNVPTKLNYPEISLPQVLEKSANEYPSKPAIIFEDIALTYGKLYENVKRFAAALQDLGIKKGDRVAVYSPNCPQFVVATYGALKAGATVVPCSSAYKERELGHQLDDSGAKVLFTHENLLPVASAAVKETGVEHLIVTSKQDYQYLENVHSTPKTEAGEYIPLLRLLQDYEPAPAQVSIAPKEDLAFLCYTGGTTGVPKGCMLTHFNCVADELHEIYFYKLKRGEEVILIFVPLFHIHGLNRCMGTYLAAAATIILFERFNVDKALDAIQRYGVTVFPGVPTAYVAIINHPDLKKYDLSSVRIWKSAAAPMPTEVWFKFKELTGASISIGWGLTEASPGLTLTPLEIKEYKPGMVGVPEIDTEIAVFSLESNSMVPSGTIGEFRAKGPQIMKGYWNKPEETAKVFVDGWLCTGDLGYMDENGVCYFVDRLKDVIKVSGFQVWPGEVEDVLNSHPAVLEAAVVGMPDEYHGEVPKAYVVLKSGYKGKVSEEELIKYCQERLAKYKAPKQVEFVSELPKTAAGKILRRALKK
ncbi:MAG: long-chain fatty acid--CoA ligase [Nitrososphaerota archaeon]|nr:long-chain fatty acid--CoA ligase [Nitrososphaerota archaeon]